MTDESIIWQFVPPWHAVWRAGPVLLAWSAASLWFAAWVKQRLRAPTGYSRNTFHLLTFATAGALQWGHGVRIVSLFGAATTLTLSYAIARGDGHPLYEALAREQDVPYRTHYIVASYLATLIGGVLSNLAAGPFALCGYLVCGLGDAAGEPIGTRWGRHWYAVPARRGVRSRRSVEGSLGVFVITLITMMAVLIALGCGHQLGRLSAAVLVIAFASTAVEAVSPHGWDNAALQVVPSVIAAWMFGA